MLEKKIIGLKIDVDTYLGMKKGVPQLLSTLSRFGLKGTFFLSYGPDSSGRAIFNLIRNPGFLKKMMRTNAARLYGIRTALYGTLLPSPMIALSFPGLVRRIQDEGHEVQFHAWDHRRWQDDLPGKSPRWIENWFEKGIASHRRLTGENPQAFGAPAWLVDERALNEMRKHAFRYLSCSRAEAPFVEQITGLPEIPSNLPCFEETGSMEAILSSLEGKQSFCVLPVHAEVEGGIWRESFERLLDRVLRMDYRFQTLLEFRKNLDLSGLSVRKYGFKLLPGRSAPCAV
ncbi:MAG: polysaccharide deacetylase family protein [Syntrophales bacterium]|nr:polysaccharide deacetylase family protein [Syntrophales bacterium]MDD5231932.1 polysaccharide deacetylase family protein [Syntrophales bacterium]